MAEKDFVVKNGLVVNSAVTINSTAIYYNGSQLVNSTSFEGTANNVAFVGTVTAANVVSNAQLTANLANYQTSAGLAANVLTLTANNTSFVGTVAAANVVSNAQLSANLANYQTTAGLSANVAVLTANNSTRLNGQLASFYTNAENITTGTLPSARISGNYTGITNVGTLGTLTVSGNVALNNFNINASSNVISIPTANVNIDSGVLFVDAINNRVGISNTAPDTELTVTGSANVSQDVRIGRDLYVGRDFIVAGNLTTTGTSVSDGDFNPASNGYSLGNTISLWNLLGIDATLTKNLSSNAVLVGTINATSNGVILTRTSFTIGNNSVNSTINSTSFTGTANNTSFVGTVSAANVVSNAQLSGNLASYQTSAGLAANVATLTANNTSFVGTVAAANVVSNAQLSGNLANYVTTTNFTSNLANYQTSAGLSANVATLTANNTSFVGTITAANVVSNAQLTANLANYQTSAGLSANVAKLTANNTSFVGTVAAANVVSNAQLTANLANYQTTAGLSANVATLTANNTSFVGTVAAANVVSNAQLVANLANYQTSAGLSANVATLTANNSTRLNGQLASFYTNAENITTGTLPSARISGAYTGITQLGTLTTLALTGNANFDSGVLFVDGTNNRVGVNTTSPSVSLQISSNDAILLPLGNTSQRPTGSNGMFRFNSDTSTFEGYSNGAWGTIAGSGAGGYYKGNLGPVGNTDNKANLYKINSNTQSNNVTISTGENALTVGPMVIDSGFNLTIEEGGRAVII